MPELRRAAAVVAVLVLVLSSAITAAQAAFTDRTSAAALPLSTATLAAPATESASASCSGLVPRATVSWAVSASPFVTGYRVFRRTGAAGPFLQVAEVPGRTSTSYVDGPLVIATAYGYRVDAVYQSWSSSSPTASVTTPVLCL